MSIEDTSPLLHEALRGRRGLWFVLALTAAVFASTLSFGWVYDDVPVIVDNDTLLAPDAPLQAFTTNVWAFAPDLAEARYYRPLFTLWTILWRHLFGLNTAGWHLGVILLHLGAVAVFWHLLRKLSGRPGVATLGAALFAVHPTRGESVAWVCGLTDPMAAVVGFGAVLAVGVGWRRHALSTLLFGLTLLSKETALIFLVFPAAIAVASFKADKTPGDSPAVPPWRPAVTTTALWGALVVVYLLVRGQVIGELSPTIHQPEEPLRLVTALIGSYARQLLAPGPASLVRPVEPATLWAALALAAWITAALLAGRVRALVWMGGLFLLPVLRVGTLQPDMMLQDRYLYMPSACWFGAIAWGGAALYDRRPTLAWPALGIAAVGLCSALLVADLPAWENDRAVWERAVAADPDSARAWFNLGVIRENDDELGEAEQAYGRATHLEPDRAIFHFRLALVLVERQALHEAWHHFSRAAELRPGDPMMLYEAGRIETFRGSLDQGVALLEAALAAVEAGTIPAGGVTRADIERELELARRRRAEHEGPPSLKWDGPPSSTWE